MREAVQQTFQSGKAKVAVLMAALMVMAVGGASANTPTDWKTTITSNLTSLASDVLLVLGSVLAAALGIFALQFAIRKALKFFKSATN